MDETLTTLPKDHSEQVVITPLSAIETLAKYQQATTVDFQQAVGQLAGLIVALKGQMDEMQRALQSKVTISAKEGRILQNAVRGKAMAICDSKTLPYAQCGQFIRDAIRREVYRLHGVGSFYDITARDFKAVLDYINAWGSLALIRKLRDKYGGGA